MKFILYDRFLESYSNVPKGIQKKVQDFIKKFKDDSTRPSIHLEPIKTFKDPQLRTARIDIKYRAILHVSPTADIFHLMWVDNHDEAMAWAQNKVFEWNKFTQTYQVYEHRETIPEQTVQKHPGEKATFCRQFSEDKLVAIGIPAPLLPSVKSIDTLSDLEELESYLPREAFENLFYLLDGMSIEEVITDIQEGKEESESFDDQLNSANNLRSFIEVTDDETLEELLSGDLLKWKIFLHPSQRSIVEKDYTGSFKLTGAAGTGKTVVALHRLKTLARSIAKNNSILFTTFTKSLVQNLKEHIYELKVPMDKVVINNIHDFIVRTSKELKLVPQDCKIVEFIDKDQKEELWKEVITSQLSEYDTDFLIREYEDVVLFHGIESLDHYLRVARIGLQVKLGRKDRKKVWELFQSFEQLKSQYRIYYLDEITNKLTSHYKQCTEKPFDHIIADEIQDFSDVELRLLRAMAAEQENDLFLVGDPLQKIYNRYLNFSRVGINIRGKRSKRLKVNYRTTEEIKRSAVAVLQNLSFDNFDGANESQSGYISLLHGAKPQYEIFKTSEEMNTFVLDRVRELTANHSIKLDEICVAARTNKSLKTAISLFHQEHLPYCSLVTQNGDKTGIRLSTFHNMKGLEFKVAILFDVNEKTVPLRYFDYDSLSEHAKRSSDKSERALLYVAMSRAIQQLLIVGIGKPSCMLKA
jgi:hypothetical protein